MSMSVAYQTYKQEKKGFQPYTMRQRGTADNQSAFITMNLIDTVDFQNMAKPEFVYNFSDGKIASKSYRDTFSHHNDSRILMDGSEGYKLKRSHFLKINPSAENSRPDNIKNKNKHLNTPHIPIMPPLTKKKFKLVKANPDFDYQNKVSLRLNLINFMSPKVLKVFNNDIIKSLQKETIKQNKTSNTNSIRQAHNTAYFEKNQYFEPNNFNLRSSLSNFSANNSLITTDIHNNGTKVLTYSRNYKDICLTGTKLFPKNIINNKPKQMQSSDKDVQTSYYKGSSKDLSLKYTSLLRDRDKDSIKRESSKRVKEEERTYRLPSKNYKFAPSVETVEEDMKCEVTLKDFNNNTESKMIKTSRENINIKGNVESSPWKSDDVLTSLLQNLLKK